MKATTPNPNIRPILEKGKPGATVLNVLMRSRDKGVSDFDVAWERAFDLALHSVPEMRRDATARDLENRRDRYAGIYEGWSA